MKTTINQRHRPSFIPQLATMDVARFVLDEIIVFTDPAAEIEAQVHKTVPGASETTPLVVLPADRCDLDDSERSSMREDLTASVSSVATEEATTLIKQSLPMVAATLYSTVAVVIVGMMYGNVGTAKESSLLIAASGLADLFSAEVTSNLFVGIGNAVDTMCAQSVGAKAYRPLWLYLQAGLLASVYCLPLIIVLGVKSASIFSGLGQPSELVDIAAVIVQVSLISLPFQIAGSAATSALMSQGQITPIFIASVIAYAISIPLGYLLGFSLGLGYVGIVMSSVVNVMIQAALVGYAVTTIPVLVASWPGWQIQEAHRVVCDKASLGASCILMIVCQNLGFNSVTLMSGLVPNAAEALSSSGIAGSLLSLTFMPMMATYAVGSVRIGVALGAGKARRASIVSCVVLAQSLLLSLVGIIFCCAVAAPFAHQYTSDPAIAQAAISLTYYLLPLVPAVGITMGLQAVFHACGKQLLSAKINFVLMIVMGISLGVVLARVLDLGIVGLWYGQIIGMASFCVAASVWMYHLDWAKEAHEAYRNAHSHSSPTDREPDMEATTESESGSSF